MGRLGGDVLTSRFAKYFGAGGEAWRRTFRLVFLQRSLGPPGRLDRELSQRIFAKCFGASGEAWRRTFQMDSLSRKLLLIGPSKGDTEDWGWGKERVSENHLWL